MSIYLFEGIRTLSQLVAEVEPKLFENEAIRIFLGASCETLTGSSAFDLRREDLETFKSLFETTIFKDVYRLWRSKFPSSTEYLLNNLSRFVDPNYEVTDDDILNVRIKTSGIHNYLIPIVPESNESWNFIDLGGQKNERRKWIHAFDDVLAVVYVSALDSFDMVY
eukprot:TRINITY_DN703_c0_g1_i10.p1 TRINITY_DN703_c0_g1~~TRINITY_DN703_c0_g1_i10.p1  ORF type:complete len:166 (+),score=34.63 TRINITY_DN703_c0_g1_i10:342-839(+)